MKVEAWLKIEKRYRYPHIGVSASTKKPETGPAEIAIRLNLELPDEIFKEPVYEMTVVVPKPSKNLPDRVTVASSLADALAAQIGFRVRIDIPEDPETA